MIIYFLQYLEIIYIVYVYTIWSVSLYYANFKGITFKYLLKLLKSFWTNFAQPSHRYLVTPKAGVTTKILCMKSAEVEQ
jgi:hypothetical protein